MSHKRGILKVEGETKKKRKMEKEEENVIGGQKVTIYFLFNFFDNLFCDILLCKLKTYCGKSVNSVNIILILEILDFAK